MDYRTLAARAARTALPVLLVASASAQQGSTVLFGDANPDYLDLPQQRRAVAPITSPFYHEDSFVTSDVRAWFLRHDFPTNVLGGYATAYAVQVRLALTESLQFVAYKDGYLDFNDDAVQDDGIVDLAAGLKWAFLQNWETDTHVAVGVGYELGIGDEEVLQDDDEVRIWTSFNKGFDRLHLGATANYTFGVGSEDDLGDSDRLFLHGHLDYWVNEFFSPVVELNYYDTVSEGDNRPLPVHGADVANLGGGGSEDTLTAGFGCEFRPATAFGLRAAYETPLNSSTDLFGYRWTFSATWSF
ncbi:MAG: hypothetical protein AAGA20_07895 [Planctomycetota bacterium]